MSETSSGMRVSSIDIFSWNKTGPSLETTPTLAVIPDVRCSRLLLRMWKCHRHLRHPRADILGCAAHWGAWSATPHAPTLAPLKDAVQAGLREHAAHRGSERRPSAAAAPTGSLSGRRSGRTAAQRKGRPDLPEGAARSSVGRRHLAAAPSGTAARRRGR